MIDLVKLKDLVTSMHQGINTVADKVEYQNTGKPIIQSKNITSGFLDLHDVRYLSKEDYCKYFEKYKPTKGDLLFCNIGTIGKSLVIEEDVDFLIAWNLFVIKIKKEQILPEYLKFYFEYLTGKKYFNKLLTGGTVKFINKKSLGEILIPLVKLEKQLNIVGVLKIVEETINKRQSQITALDELTKSLFLEMFGDPINNSRKWEVKKLKDVTDKILSGSTPKGGSKVYIENGITFLRSQNVWKNRLDLDDVVYIDKETHNKMIKSSLMYGDILMTKTGRINTENSSLGRAAIFKGKNDSANINGHVYLIRLKKDIINEFILFILTTDEYKEYIRSVCVGGIDKRQINKEHLEEFPIISPPVELQVHFSKLLAHVENLKSEILISLKELEDTFNSILQRAFKGELFQD